MLASFAKVLSARRDRMTRRSRARHPALLGGLVIALTLSLLPLWDAPAHAASRPLTELDAAAVTGSHPRIASPAGDFAGIAGSVQDASVSGSWYRALKKNADALLTAPVSTYVKTSGSMLDVSGRVLDRAYTLGLVWRVTGDSRYAERLWNEMSGASAFPDWNPSHFLDTAEMAAAFGVSYDWLYDYWSVSRRTQLADAVSRLAFEPAMLGYSASSGWSKLTNNWNIVCNGGLGLAALAFADILPAASDRILTSLRSSITNGLTEYADDGGYREGITYWSYATEYLVTFIASLQLSTGSDYSLLSSPGLDKTGDFALRMSGPSGRSFNYGDAYSSAGLTTALLGLARLYDDRTLLARAVTGSTGEDAEQVSARGLLWYTELDPSASDRASVAGKALDGVFADTGVGSMRSSWTDRSGTSAMMRAGRAPIDSHGDLDSGDFTLDSLGVNWAVETGTESYSLPGYEDGSPRGARWAYYRKRAEGQNTLVMTPGASLDSSTTPNTTLATVTSNPDSASMIGDLTSSNPTVVSSWKRGISLFDSRQRVLVQDEVSAPNPISPEWYMHTMADIAIAADGRSAVLTQDNQQLLARIATPGTTFSYSGATSHPASPAVTSQDANSRIKKLVIVVPSSTSIRLAVEFVPLRRGVIVPAVASMSPLSAWSGSASASAAASGITVDGSQLRDFRPGVLSYSFPVSVTDSVPVVAASAESGATVTVTQASSLPGRAVITVTQSGKAARSYIVVFHPGALQVRSVVATANQESSGLLTDGRIGATWSTTGDQSIVLDYGRSAAIKHFEIYWAAIPSGGATFEWFASNDQSSWTRAYAGSGMSPRAFKWAWTYTFPKSFRYWKLVVHGNGGSDRTTQIDEIAGYGVDSVAEAPIAKTGHATATTTSAAAKVSSGGTTRLTFNATASSGRPLDSNTTFTYTSSSAGVATVDDSGTVTGVGEGLARITATATVGRDIVAASMLVTVVDDVKKVIPDSSDTFVQGGQNSTNYGSARNLQILAKTAYPDWEQRAFVSFDLAGVDPSTVQSAAFTFSSVINASGQTADLTAFAVTTPWSETGMTFANQPAMEYRISTAPVSSTESIVSMDVTDYVRSQTGSRAGIGLVQKNPPGGFGPQILVRARESANPPTLVIHQKSTTVATDAPTILAATSTQSSDGSVSGTVSGSPGSKVSIDVSSRASGGCVAVIAAGETTGSTDVVIGADGIAPFAVGGAFGIGSSVMAVATINGVRSPVACSTASASAGTVTRIRITADADAFVQGGAPASTNFGSATKLQMLAKTNYREWEQRGYLGFDLGSIDRAKIVSAKLVTTAWLNSTTEPALLDARAVTGSWTESSITFANQPQFGGVIGTTTVDATATSRTIDVTSYVSSGSGSRVSIGLGQLNPTGGFGPQMLAHSRESSSPPVLLIDVSK